MPSREELDLDRLVEDREYKTMAAIVRHFGDVVDPKMGLGAVRRLAGAADSEEAFTWLWLSLDPSSPPPKSTEKWMEAASGLATGVRVAEALRSQVAQFVLSNPVDADSRHPRDVFQARLLAGLPSTVGWVRELAKEALAREDLSAADRVTFEALRILAGSNRGPDRDVAHRAAARIPERGFLQGRLDVLLHVPPARFRAADRKAILDAIKTVDAQSLPAEAKPQAARLLARLPGEDLLSLLSSSWIGPPETTLGQIGLVSHLSDDVLRNLLKDRSLRPDVSQALIVQAANLPHEKLTPLASWLAPRIRKWPSTSSCRPFRRCISDGNRDVDPALGRRSLRPSCSRATTGTGPPSWQTP